MEKKEIKKKKLEEAELRVIQFELNDVIVASGCVSAYGGPSPCNVDCGDDCSVDGI